MTPLAERLIRQIAATGPISVADYMTTCLLDPEHGYYSTRDPFGSAGDFTTAPEISQMFGELLGLALAQSWIDQGCPDRFTLAELGPGRGTLMVDILRASRAVPGFHAALDLWLVEASPVLRAAQASRLAGLSGLNWVDRAEELPEDQPLYLVANEFFDALPIRQFRRSGQGWGEVRVTKDETGLAFALTEATPVAELDHRLTDTVDGDTVELCSALTPTVTAISSRIANAGGAALIIDYADWRSLGDTLQALKNHQIDPVLNNPGKADLTAHVDFEAIAKTAEAAGAGVSGMTPQGVFLERLGITDRARALARGLSDAALESHIAAHRRLTHPEEMGSLFKVIGLTQKGAPMLPGLSE